MPVALWYSCVMAGRCWGRLAIRMGRQNNTWLPAWNRVHIDLLQGESRCSILPKYVLSFPLKLPNSPITGPSNGKKKKKECSIFPLLSF